MPFLYDRNQKLLYVAGDYLSASFYVLARETKVGRQKRCEKTMSVSASPTIPTIQIRGSKMERMNGKQGRPPSL
jgi:hypothetical protein